MQLKSSSFIPLGLLILPQLLQPIQASPVSSNLPSSSQHEYRNTTIDTDRIERLIAEGYAFFTSRYPGAELTSILVERALPALDYALHFDLYLIFRRDGVDELTFSKYEDARPSWSVKQWPTDPPREQSFKPADIKTPIQEARSIAAEHGCSGPFKFLVIEVPLDRERFIFEPGELVHSFGYERGAGLMSCAVGDVSHDFDRSQYYRLSIRLRQEQGWFKGPPERRGSTPGLSASLD